MAFFRSILSTLQLKTAPSGPDNSAGMKTRLPTSAIVSIASIMWPNRWVGPNGESEKTESPMPITPQLWYIARAQPL